MVSRLKQKRPANSAERFELNESKLFRITGRIGRQDQVDVYWPIRGLPGLKMNRVTANIPIMSLAEIEKAVDELSPDELAKLAAHIARRDKLAWDDELEEDFSPGGKHHKILKEIDAEIDSGKFTPLP